LKRLVAAGVATTGLLLSVTAAAQIGPGGGGAGSGAFSGPSQGPPGAMEVSPRGTMPKESPRSAKLFDSTRVTQSFQLDIGPLWYRPAGRALDASGRLEPFQRGTGEVLAGVAITAKWKPFYLTGLQQTNLRVFGAKSAAWSILTQQLAVGLYVGPFEPEVRIGGSLLTVDVFEGDYSFEALTPRVAAAVGIHLGKIRLDIATHSEYLWRWFGPDYLIRGVSLGLRLDVPQPKTPVFSDSPPR
jgi:hypothetical protein